MAVMTGGASGTMANWTPEVWSKLATITYRSNVVLPDKMDRRWEPELGVGRGDTVNIPAFSQNATSIARTTFGTAAALTFDGVTESQVQLVVNKLRYKAYGIPVEAAIQAMPSYVALLTEGIGTAIAVDVDGDLAGDDTNGLDAFTAIGADNVDVTDDDVLSGETNLNSVNAPMSGRFFVVSPQTRASLLKIDSYRNQLYSSIGKLDASAGPGYLGPLYSLQAFMCNNLEAGSAGKKNAIWQQEAIAFAAQKELTINKDLNVEDGLINQYVGWMVYGYKMVKSTFGREVDGK